MSTNNFLFGLNMHTWPFAVRAVVGFLVMAIGSALPALIVGLTPISGISWSQLVEYYGDHLILLSVLFLLIWWLLILGDYLVRQEQSPQR